MSDVILGQKMVGFFSFGFRLVMLSRTFRDDMKTLWTVRGGRERHTSHSKMRMSVGHSVTPVAVH